MTPQQIKERLAELAAIDANKPGVKLRRAFLSAAIICFALVIAGSLMLKLEPHSTLLIGILQVVSVVGAASMIAGFISSLYCEYHQGIR